MKLYIWWDSCFFTPLPGMLQEVWSPEKEEEQAFMERQENQTAQPWASKGCKALWGKCPLWVINFSVTKPFLGLLSEAQLCSLPSDREGRGLTDTLLNSQLGWIWASLLEILPTTETFCPQAQLLFLQAATSRGFLCFAFPTQRPCCGSGPNQAMQNKISYQTC